MVTAHTLERSQNVLLERSDKSPFVKGGFRGNVNMQAVK